MLSNVTHDCHQNTPPSNSVGIVVPTLGTRTAWLASSVSSILNQTADQCFTLTKLVIVCPGAVKADLETKFDDQRVTVVALDEPGLSRAINYGVEKIAADVDYVGWIGDDDLLAPRSLKTQVEKLRQGRFDYVIGSVLVIDESGLVINELKAKKFSTWFARYGRNFIPQPGSLISSSSWISVDGLDTGLKSAMDLDLFLKLDSVGSGLCHDQVVAAYRWHRGSVSANKSSWSENETIQSRFKQNRVTVSIFHNNSIRTIANRLAHKFVHRNWRHDHPEWIPIG